MNNNNTCSPIADKVPNQSKITTLPPSENRTLLAVQSGHSCSLPKDLKIVRFCVYDNKMLAVCHTKQIPTKPKTFSFYIFNLSSGVLELVYPIIDPVFDRDIQFVDMCLSKIEDWQCMAFGYTDSLPSLAEYYLIHFLKLEGEQKCYTLALERPCSGPMCSFDNTLLSYSPECHDILVFDTSKWPVKENQECFDIGLDFDIVVTDLITCSGKGPNKRLVIVEYLAEKGHGILCLDLKGDKLWEISPSHDPHHMHYPRGDNKGHIFLIDHSSQTILVRKDELIAEVLLKLPGRIVDYHWSNTMNTLVVLHYNKKRDSLLVSCYDTVEQ